MMRISAAVVCWIAVSASAFVPIVIKPAFRCFSHVIVRDQQQQQIVSPFDPSNEDSNAAAAGSTTTTTVLPLGDEPLPLTWENVELVLDTMRDYLIQDGGNVAIQEIDGPVVRLELQGACGTCPSSTQTLKMGLERGLKERIPEIQEVIQAMPEGPELTEEQVDVVLDGVRPFLQVAGGSIWVESITGVGSTQPVIELVMEGASASLNSVKLEIAQRLQRHFMLAGLQVRWAGDDDDF
jgi:lysyl-tRNA synthetase class 2